MEEENKIKTYFEKNGINLTQSQCNQFYKYYLLLEQWNQKFNLTAITSFEDVIVKHFYDSVVCHKSFNEGAFVIDVGCGAGFPSIPLKILRPDLNFTLVDSVNKKIGFVEMLIKELNLTNITAIHSRVEDLAKKQEHREKYDYCVSRAVASLNVLCEYCLPFVKVGGTMVAYKSTNTEEELTNAQNAIKCLGGKVQNVIDFSVADFCRKVVFINKIAVTSNKYPRGGNKPRVSPIV